MADEDNVIFVRGSSNVTDSEHDDVWDDSALIKAYDKAINLAKDEVAKQMGLNTIAQTDLQPKSKSKQSQKKNKPHKRWTVGAPCRAVYSEDKEIYEATVRKILGKTGTCIVEFIGYGNMEEVKLNSLLESNGLQSQLAQKKQALSENLTEDTAGCQYEQTAFASKSSKECNTTVEDKLDDKMDFELESMRCFKNSFMPGPRLPSSEMMPPAPPLPPQLMAKLPENDADALSSMLMSWYISGFHTGYYHGLKQAQSKQEKRKTC